MNGIEKKTIMTRIRIRTQPVGMAAASIHPIFDFVVNKSSTYEGEDGGWDDVELKDTVDVAESTIIVDTVVKIDEFTTVVAVTVDWFCLFRLDISLLMILDDVRDLYSALSQS